MATPKKTFRSPSAGSETGPGRGLGTSSARSGAGIEGTAGKNVSKVNRNGSASPVGTTSAKKKKAPAKKMTPEEGIAADLNAFLNFNAGR